MLCICVWHKDILCGRVCPFRCILGFFFNSLGVRIVFLSLGTIYVSSYGREKEGKKKEKPVFVFITSGAKDWTESSFITGLIPVRVFCQRSYFLDSEWADQSGAGELVWGATERFCVHVVVIAKEWEVGYVGSVRQNSLWEAAVVNGVSESVPLCARVCMASTSCTCQSTNFYICHCWCKSVVFSSPCGDDAKMTLGPRHWCWCRNWCVRIISCFLPCLMSTLLRCLNKLLYLLFPCTIDLLAGKRQDHLMLSSC